MFQTDADKLNFLIETEAELSELLADAELSAEARAVTTTYSGPTAERNAAEVASFSP